MTAPQPRSQSPLRIVPPSQIGKASGSPASTKTPSLPQTEMSTSDTAAGLSSPIPWRRWAIGAGLIFGIGVIMHIPVPPPSWTEGELRVPDSSSHRQTVYAGKSGKVIKIHVQSGDFVRAGQVLVELELTEIDQKISDLQTEIKKQEGLIQEAQIRYQGAHHRISELNFSAAIARDRANRAKSRSGNLQAPEVAIYDAEVQELRSRQVRLRNEMRSTQQMIDELEEAIQRRIPLVSEGAISEEQLSPKKQELIQRQQELQGQKDQIHETNQKIQGVQAKKQLARQTLNDGSVGQVSDFQEAQIKLTAAVAEISKYQKAALIANQVLEEYQRKLGQLMRDQSSYQMIRANRDGRVYGADLAGKVNSQVDGKEKLFEIVDLTTLEVPVEIDQRDRDVVHTGMMVEVRPMQPNQPKQISELKNDDSAVRQDPTQQKRQLFYFTTVKNQDGSLRPGEKVYVTVLTKPMPLYQVIGRELRKLFKSRQFGDF
ncbi:MAG: HlyD family efflux transporter periplasmic adaptor subunit [Limnothrix sp. CACIAM 69d]|nr:MAG: HlyD family efflux transporter periplasmic adaptor subunit [Limnothrix sp. CACIAM 69d]